MKTTTITYSVANVPSTCLHLEGEIKIASLTREVAKDFYGYTTNHFGKSEPTLHDAFIGLSDDVVIEVEVDDVKDSSIINFSNISEFEETHIKYAMLARMIFAAM